MSDIFLAGVVTGVFVTAVVLLIVMAWDRLSQ